MSSADRNTVCCMRVRTMANAAITMLCILCCDEFCMLFRGNVHMSIVLSANLRKSMNKFSERSCLLSFFDTCFTDSECENTALYEFTYV